LPVVRFLRFHPSTSTSTEWCAVRGARL